MPKRKSVKKNFRPSVYIKDHPYNRKIVNKIKRDINKYIKGFYNKGVQPKYKDWYVGVSKDPDNDRTNVHKIKRRIKTLANFKSFYAYGLANARQVEKELCNEFKLKHCHVIGGLTKDSVYVYVYNLTLSK